MKKYFDDNKKAEMHISLAPAPKGKISRCDQRTWYVPGVPLN